MPFYTLAIHSAIWCKTKKKLASAVILLTRTAMFSPSMFIDGLNAPSANIL